MSGGFGTLLQDRFDRYGQLCVGIDPHPYLLSDWGLSDSARGALEFGRRVIEAAADRIGVVKPQVAFFERHGSAGFAALEKLLAEAREAGLLTIADAKRGDIGSTVGAYAQAWLGPGSPLEADAITLSAYPGLGSLAETIEVAAAAGKGIFVLAATSNPEAVALQTARTVPAGETATTVAAGIVSGVRRWNDSYERLGPAGVVIGATVRLSDYGIRAVDLKHTPVLAPGFGHQGAGFESVHGTYAEAAPNAIVSVSRSVLGSGPAQLARSIDLARLELAECLS